MTDPQLPTRPEIPSGYRELFRGEETKPDDLIWLAGNGPFEPLANEYEGPMYAYRPQPSPSECGHFMHIRKAGDTPRTELQAHIATSQGHEGYVHASFARVLEGELADAQHKLSFAKKAFDEAAELSRHMSAVLRNIAYWTVPISRPTGGDPAEPKAD